MRTSVSDPNIEVQPSRSPMSRRSFLGLAFFSSLGLLLAQSIAVLFNFLKPVTSGGFGGEIFAGKIEEFAVDSVNRIAAGRFYLSRTEAGCIKNAHTWVAQYPGLRRRVNSIAHAMDRCLTRMAR